MPYTVSDDGLHRFRLMLDSPAHERVEHGRAAVHVAVLGDRGTVNGRPVAPANPVSESDAGADRGEGAGDAYGLSGEPSSRGRCGNR